jgi:YegS/Rv2252/BmrU family lipid kinase
MSEISYIVNPAGHGGAGIRVWEEFQSVWSEPIDPEDVRFTERQGHARDLARSTEGYDILAVVGGDGTVGEVLSGIMDRSEHQPKLAIIPAGTGNDIGRNLGIFSVQDALAALRAGHTRRLDLIRIDCDVEGQADHRYSFLATAVGFSSIPMVKPWMKRFLGPTGAYYLGTILQTIVYRPPEMIIRWGGREHRGRTWMVIVGNVERTAGGSMRLAPGARPDDGAFETSIIPARRKWNLLTKMMPQIASGAHVEEADVTFFQAKEMEVACDPPGLVEIDGDLFGLTPARFNICPSAAEILCPGS